MLMLCKTASSCPFFLRSRVQSDVKLKIMRRDWGVSRLARSNSRELNDLGEERDCLQSNIVNSISVL